VGIAWTALPSALASGDAGGVGAKAARSSPPAAGSLNGAATLQLFEFAGLSQPASATMMSKIWIGRMEEYASKAMLSMTPTSVMMRACGPRHRMDVKLTALLTSWDGIGWCQVKL
jgi:hypothetical protein